MCSTSTHRILHASQPQRVQSLTVSLSHFTSLPQVTSTPQLPTHALSAAAHTCPLWSPPHMPPLLQPSTLVLFSISTLDVWLVLIHHHHHHHRVLIQRRLAPGSPLRPRPPCLPRHRVSRPPRAGVPTVLHPPLPSPQHPRYPRESPDVPDVAALLALAPPSSQVLDAHAARRPRSFQIQTNSLFGPPGPQSSLPPKLSRLSRRPTPLRRDDDFPCIHAFDVSDRA